MMTLSKRVEAGTMQVLEWARREGAAPEWLRNMGAHVDRTDPKWLEKRLAFSMAARTLELHEDHGRGCADGGPDHCDCPCRATSHQEQCAMTGCGFCRAASDEAEAEPLSDWAGYQEWELADPDEDGNIPF